MSTQRFIAKVTYRGSYRVTTVYVKLQYGALFGMTETLSRAWSLGWIRWFRIETIKAGEITPDIRAGLQRWPEALRPITEVA